jgi:hypothetical protein
MKGKLSAIVVSGPFGAVKVQSPSIYAEVMATRLVPSHQVPKALAIFNGGNALASVIAATVGSYLGLWPIKEAIILLSGVRLDR